MTATQHDDKNTTLNEPDGMPAPETPSEGETPAQPPRDVKIAGDGNAVGNSNVVAVAKNGGTVNFNLWVDTAEMLIQALEKLDLSDEEIVDRLLRLLVSCSNNSKFPQQVRGRAVEAGLKIKEMPLVQIRVDRELLALIGMFLVGDFVKEVIQALRRDREERGLPPVPDPAPSPQSKKRPKLAPRRSFEPELVFVPAGEFTMGTSKREIVALRRQYAWARDFDFFSREQPQHPVYLPDYYIGKYPVTNAQYRAFVRATGHRAPGHWDDGRIPRGEEEHPAWWLSWGDVWAYCAWLADVTGKPYRLPTEAEWEKAARGMDGRLYPWGNEPPSARLCNFDDNEDGPTPVGRYSPQGDSPYGCADMAGNVLEWTRTRWGPDWREPAFTYPYRHDAREEVVSGDYHIFRGGGWWDGAAWVRCAARVRRLHRQQRRRWGAGVRCGVFLSFL